MTDKIEFLRTRPATSKTYNRLRNVCSSDKIKKRVPFYHNDDKETKRFKKHFAKRSRRNGLN